MNQYLLLASFGEDEMLRHVAKGEEQLLDLIERSYLTSGASLEVYVLDGAVNPITTDVFELLNIAEQRQKQRKAMSSKLELFARDASPRFVIVVAATRTDVAFGGSQVEAIENFVENYTRYCGGPLSESDAHLVRQAILVRDYGGSSYSRDQHIEARGDDSRFDQAFAGLAASQTLKA